MEVLAISKDELTPANVAPFHIVLTDLEPSSEKAMRYNRKLTEFINTEVDMLL